MSLAGQVLYDVTREQTLIKTLGKGTSGPMSETGPWVVAGWDYNTMSYQPSELCTALDAMKAIPGWRCLMTMPHDLMVYRPGGPRTQAKIVWGLNGGISG